MAVSSKNRSSLSPLSAFWIMIAVSMVAFAGCQAVSYTQLKEIRTTCIENGGSWIEGNGAAVISDRTTDRCEMEK